MLFGTDEDVSIIRQSGWMDEGWYFPWLFERICEAYSQTSKQYLASGHTSPDLVIRSTPSTLVQICAPNNQFTNCNPWTEFLGSFSKWHTLKEIQAWR